jgi:hypothetical protein
MKEDGVDWFLQSIVGSLTNYTMPHPKYRNLVSQDLYKRACLNEELCHMQTEKQM